MIKNIKGKKHSSKQYFIVNLLLFFCIFMVTAPAEIRAEERTAPGDRPGPDRPAPDRPGGGNGGGNGGNNPDNPDNPGNDGDPLQTLVTQLNLTPINIEGLGLPSIEDPIAQLGKQLFFSKNLGGVQSAACASCHHPMLGAGDNLSLPVGVNAVNALGQSRHDLLGLGRFNGYADHPVVPRNAPTLFNLGLNNRAMFWDSRVEVTRNGQILTPDSPLNDQGQRQPDQNFPAGTTLAAAQARFPVTNNEEMRDQFMSELSNQELRAQLTSRFDNSDSAFSTSWPTAFNQAFGSPEVTFNKIAEAIGEYERSMIFINNPWKAYLEGDDDAMTAAQKSGAVLFFTPRNQGGAGCAGCHRGSTFSSPRHHLVAFPQIGPGKGNDSPTDTSQDFGRENVTNNAGDRYHFRPPSLLNIAMTAPYGHTGAYQTLEQVVSHYNNPRRAIDNLFAARNGEPFSGNNEAPFCRLPQIVGLMAKSDQRCESLYPDAYANSMAGVTHLQQARNGDVPANSPLRGGANLSRQEVSQVAAFLRALTDPCVQSRECLSPWILEGNSDDQDNFPDDQPLIAHDANEDLL